MCTHLRAREEPRNVLSSDLAMIDGHLSSATRHPASRILSEKMRALSCVCVCIYRHRFMSV